MHGHTGILIPARGPSANQYERSDRPSRPVRRIVGAADPALWSNNRAWTSEVRGAGSHVRRDLMGHVLCDAPELVDDDATPVGWASLPARSQPKPSSAEPIERFVGALRLRAPCNDRASARFYYLSARPVTARRASGIDHLVIAGDWQAFPLDFVRAPHLAAEVRGQFTLHRVVPLISSDPHPPGCPRFRRSPGLQNGRGRARP